MSDFIVYHPNFSPELNWYFASYTESCHSFTQELVINGKRGVYSCLSLKEATSVQKAKYEGWRIVPEQPVKEVVEVVAPKKRGRPKKK